MGRANLLAQPYRQNDEGDANGDRPGHACVQHPVEPFDTAVFDEAVIEAYEGQAYECRREREGKFGDECNYIGLLHFSKS